MTIDQKEKYLENENFSERTLKIGLQRDQHFYRYNANEKKNCYKRDQTNGLNKRVIPNSEHSLRSLLFAIGYPRR